VKIKTVGDAVMLAGPFGAAAAADGAVVNAVEALCRLICLLTDDGAAGEAQTISVGVHVGPVVAAVLGTTRLGFDVFGDTVNTASRATSSPRQLEAGGALVAPSPGTVTITGGALAQLRAAGGLSWAAGCDVGIPCAAVHEDGPPRVAVHIGPELSCEAKGKAALTVHHVRVVERQWETAGCV